MSKISNKKELSEPKIEVILYTNTNILTSSLAEDIDDSRQVSERYEPFSWFDSPTIFDDPADPIYDDQYWY